MESQLLSSRVAPNRINDSLSGLSETTIPNDIFTLSPSRRSALASNQSLESAVEPNPKLESPSVVEDHYYDNLHLRSSTHNITAVNGYTLYASPILSTQLFAILFASYQDLTANHDQTDETGFYQLNYTTWCFEVAIANGTLRYGSILSIVNRFLQLTPSQHENNITWTRVGCLYNGDNPIADVAIVPLNTELESINTELSNADTSLIPTTPVQIMTVSPFGIINSTEIVNSNALDFYREYSVDALPKRQASSLEREIILKVLNTGLYITLHILREPDGIAARALALFFTVTIFLAICKLALGSLAEFAFGSWGSNALGKLYGLDSGSYYLGQLSARFIMKSTARDSTGKIVAFSPTTWEALAKAILVPLQSVSKTEEVYAMGGNISGPDPVNGTDKLVILGEWQMKVGPRPITVHDEL